MVEPCPIIPGVVLLSYYGKRNFRVTSTLNVRPDNYLGSFEIESQPEG